MIQWRVICRLSNIDSALKKTRGSPRVFVVWVEHFVILPATRFFMMSLEDRYGPQSGDHALESSRKHDPVVE